MQRPDGTNDDVLVPRHRMRNLALAPRHRSKDVVLLQRHWSRNLILAPRQQAKCFALVPRQSVLRADRWIKLQMAIFGSNFS